MTMCACKEPARPAVTRKTGGAAVDPERSDIDARAWLRVVGLFHEWFT